LRFFALRTIIGLKIPGVVIPRSVFTQPGSFAYRSLRDENRSMSAMPRKRRLAVNASSVAMGQQRTHAAQRDTGVLSDPVPRCVRPRFCDGAPIDYRGLQSCADYHDRVKRHPGDQGWRGRRSITSTAGLYDVGPESVQGFPAASNDDGWMPVYLRWRRRPTASEARLADLNNLASSR
jgi:hypothetical protein